uniref:ethanolamine kinase n=1 Tax=Strigamia maritima TaxID=126957 RepID=T1JJE5_STRMM
MEGANPPHFDLTIDPDKIEVDFYQILETVRPLWTKSDYVFERSSLSLSRGLLNTMVKCYSKTDDRDAIMIRIHNVNMTQWLDRSVEVKCLKILAPLDCAPRIIATFVNGFCYQFFHGEILTHTRLGEDPIWRLIASDFAKFHSTELDSDLKESAIRDKEEKLEKIWDAYPDELKDPKKNEIFKREIPPKEELKAEISSLHKVCENLACPIVLCHNDTRGENIIWNEEERRIHFVDFEAMTYNYQAQEIAAHFQRFCEKYYEFTGKNPSNVTEKDVRRLYVEVNKWHLALLLMVCAFAPVFEVMNIIPEGHLDMFEFGMLSHKEYLKEKDMILAMKMPE